MQEEWDKYLLVCLDDSSKRLVELPDRNLIFGDTCSFQSNWDGLCWCDGKVNWIDGCVCTSTDSG